MDTTDKEEKDYKKIKTYSIQHSYKSFIFDFWHDLDKLMTTSPEVIIFSMYKMFVFR